MLMKLDSISQISRTCIYPTEFP